MLKYPNRAVKAFITVFLKEVKKSKTKKLPTAGIEPAAFYFKVGILSLYQVFPGGYRLFCTAYKCYMFINPVVNNKKLCQKVF